MELGFALLAKFADTSADGTVALIGGGIRSIMPERLPVTLPVLTLVAEVLVPPEEWGREHRVSFELYDPRGVAVPGPVAGETVFTPGGAADRPDIRFSQNFVFGLLGLTLAEPGRYEFRLLGDGAPLGTVVLDVTQRAQG
jgi:hypothetical protein